MPKTSDAPRERRARAPRRRQQEILDAAARVFHEKGYESTSIQDIADSVGILKGSLYYYITSKEDLLYQIIEGVHREGLKNVDAVEALDASPLEKLRAFVTGHLLYNAHNLVRTAVFFQDFRSLTGERRKQILAERDAYEKYLRDLIRQAQRDGSVCPDVDPKVASITVLGMLNWIYNWYRPGGERSAREIGELCADFVTSGLHCDPKTHRPGHRRSLAPLPQAFADALASSGARRNGSRRG